MAEKKIDLSKMRPLMADCRKCPFPSWRKPEMGLCSICATLVVDEDGNLHVSPKPLIDKDSERKLTWRQKRAMKGGKNGRR